MAQDGKPKSGAGDVSLGGMFRSLGGFVELLSNLAQEEGGHFSRTGEIGGDEKSDMKAVYGFSVRVGGSGKPHIEKFGNVQDRGGGPVVEEAREPMVDVFDEGEHLLLVAELPGVDAADIRFEVKDDILTLNAAHGERKYRKELLLPSLVRAEEAQPSYLNGIYKLKLPKAG